MEHLSPPTIPQEERFMALLCHFIGGFFFSVIIFFVNKKSKFLKFHALQSLIFGFPLFLISLFSLYLMFIPLDEMRQFIEKNLFLSSFLMLPVGLTILINCYSFYVGIPAFRGETKRYPLIGDWVYKKVFGYVEVSEPKELIISETDIPSSDEKLMAFVSYISALIMGFLPLLFVYYAYKKKSKFIAFHSLQIIYGFITFFILIYIPYIVLTAILEIDSNMIYPDSPFLNSLLSGGINESLFSLIGIAFIFLSYKSLNGKIAKFPILGNLAYNKIYHTVNNLPNHSTPPPNGGQNKGLI